jgi:plasmid stabilization system protein ParE
MRLAYLSTPEAGLRWLRSYYRRNPQLDVKRAAAALRSAEAVLREHPAAGRHFEDFEGVREYLLHGTSFSILYTVAGDTVWIIDIRDQRGQRSAATLRQFMRELHARAGGEIG